MEKGALVIGGGIAGIQVALDLAEARIPVHLVEKGPSIGGRMAQLDKTLPTNDCSICILSPNLVEVARHPLIRLLTCAEVAAVDGGPGDFRVTVRRRPRYIDEDRCLGCRECIDACVYKEPRFPNDFDMGLGKRKPIYMPFPQAVPLVPVIDADTCIWFQSGKCPRTCVEACGDRAAIDFQQSEELVDLEVGAVVVATGFDELDPRPLSRYGYGLFDNVLTGLEFERLLNAAGPTGGRVVRPSDGKVPRSVFFVQCVGSRDVKVKPYCSRVCCTYAIKQCMVAREHEPDIEELTVGYIDLRTYGKGFENYYRRSVEETGVRFLRGSPAKVLEDEETGNLTVFVEDGDRGRPTRVEVELVVLSSAMTASRANAELAGVLGIEVDGDDFFLPGQANEPVASTRPGVFLCGCAEGPKDIPDSVAQASACATGVARYLHDRRVEETPADVELVAVDGEPRVGVFVCHCGHNIGGVVDVPSVAAYAAELPGVVYATDNLFTCSDDTQTKIQEAIRERRLNRVVVAACTPRTHESLFRETCAGAGLNPYLFEMANIRDQCSWVHAHDPEAATAKARDLVRMAVARARLLSPLQESEVDVVPRVVVVGGGIAGIEASLGLARQGIEVWLVERRPELGGRLRELHRLYPDGDEAAALVADRLEELEELGVRIATSTEVAGVGGHVGDFTVELRDLERGNGDSVRSVAAGALVLAIGAGLYDPTGEFGYGDFPNVITNQELEGLLAEDDEEVRIDGRRPQTVAFVQCVGSRSSKGNPGCSRTCCHTAIKQAIALRRRGVNVVVFYRDVRTFGRKMEERYREARGLGVRFLRYEEDAPPEVLGEGRARRIELKSPELGEPLELAVDGVVLSVGMVPREAECGRLQQMLKVPRSADGFFMERHVKLGPVETNTEGIFVCGCAQGPKDVADTVAQAGAAAAKAAALVTRESKRLDAVTCAVDPELCRACGQCVELCEFNAPLLEDRGDGVVVSRIQEALCKGCGTCAAWCPTGAIVARHFTDRQVETMIDALFESGAKIEAAVT